MTKGTQEQNVRLQLKLKHRQSCLHNYCHRKYYFGPEKDYICEVPQELAMMLFESGKYQMAPLSIPTIPNNETKTKKSTKKVKKDEK